MASDGNYGTNQGLAHPGLSAASLTFYPEAQEPVIDSDADGVADGDDHCPGVPAFVPLLQLAYLGHLTEGFLRLLVTGPEYVIMRSDAQANLYIRSNSDRFEENGPIAGEPADLRVGGDLAWDGTHFAAAAFAPLNQRPQVVFRDLGTDMGTYPSNAAPATYTWTPEVDDAPGLYLQGGRRVAITDRPEGGWVAAYGNQVVAISAIGPAPEPMERTVAVSTGIANSPAPDLLTYEDQVFIALEDGPTQQLVLSRFDANLFPTGTITLPGAVGVRAAPSIAALTTDLVAVFHERQGAGPPNREVSVHVVDLDGAPDMPEFLVSQRGFEAYDVSAAAGDGFYGALWLEEHDRRAQVWFRRVDLNGSMSPPIRLSQGTTVVDSPALGWDGQNFVAIWRETSADGDRHVLGAKGRFDCP
jgi:hypothetical protein